ncbi:MAG: polysaccharide biosynthesis/export family protein [Verrucomicrobiota bacterium]
MMNFSTIITIILAFASAMGTGLLAQDGSSAAASGGAPQALPSNYRLNVTDQVTVSVFEEPELTVTQLIPANGMIRMPLLGEISLLGLTIREAEYKVQNAYIDARLLRKPQVYITVSGYVAREFSIFGQVSGQGQIPFPIERDSMDIVEAIARSGGFTGIARSSAVRITRKDAAGHEENIIVDVEELIEDQDTTSRRGEFLVYPGDIIYVPERIF